MSASKNILLATSRFVARVMPARLLSSRHCFHQWERKGIHILPATFYSPVPVVKEIDTDVLAARKYSLAGEGWSETEQLQLLATCRRPDDEVHVLQRFIAEHGRSTNGYNEVDQIIYFGLLRYIRPRRILEVGAGRSTLIAACALQMNQRESSQVVPELISIEPYPKAFITAGVKGLSRLIPKRLQDVSLSHFDSLDDGDILFIDSSHVCKAGSDVQWLFSEILPRLKRGVNVHIHDVFLPFEYPIEWIRDRRRFWNEQYLLQAFLSMNHSFCVMLASYWLSRDKSDAFKAALGIEHNGRPASFWIKRCQ